MLKLHVAYVEYDMSDVWFRCVMLIANPMVVA